MGVPLVASLYVMRRADDGAMKVGLSQDLDGRQRALKRNHTLAFASEPWAHADKIERYAHALLHDKLADRREYFAATLAEAVAAIETARRMVEAGEPKPAIVAGIHLKRKRASAAAAAVRPGEEWRPICGLEGRYEVSKFGRVRSLDRIGTQGSRWGHPVEVRIKGRLLTPSPAAGGYLYARINGAGALVHRLVLEAFVGPCPDGHECAHQDGDPANNNLSNLRWATKVENQADRRRHGTMPIGKNHYLGKKTHCKRGHEFNEETTRLFGGGRWRACKACEREKARDPEGKARRAKAKRERYQTDPEYRARWNERQREYWRRCSARQKQE